MKVLSSKLYETEFGKNYLTIFTHGGNEDLGMQGQKLFLWGTKELSGEIEYTIDDFLTKQKEWVNDKGVTITSTYIVGMK